MVYIKKIGWIILEVLLFVIFTVAIGGLLSIITYQLMQPDPSILSGENLDKPFTTLMIEYLPLLIGSLAALYLTHVKIFKRPLSTTGFQSISVAKEFLQGYGLSFLMISVGFGLLFYLNMIEIEGYLWNPSLFFGFLILFLIQSSFEEIVSRSFLIPMLSNYCNPWIALILSSSVFALLHYTNPNITLISLCNIFMAGILMGLLFLRTRQIWMPIGLHAGWNFLQGSFYGFEVSGFDVYSLIDSKEIGNDLWTGGAFGFEGSLISLIFLSSGSAWIIINHPILLTQNIFKASMVNKNVSFIQVEDLERND